MKMTLVLTGMARLQLMTNQSISACVPSAMDTEVPADVPMDLLALFNTQHSPAATESSGLPAPFSDPSGALIVPISTSHGCTYVLPFRWSWARQSSYPQPCTQLSKP